jgi:Ca2+-binding RTX toxin-like protein
MTITITSSVTSGSFNYNVGTGSYLATFNDSFTPGGGNFGWLYGAPSPYDQYGIDSGTQAFFVDGNFTYSQGSFNGYLDSISFGTGLNYTSSGFGQSSTPLSLTSTLFTLGFSPALDDPAGGGSGDAVHELIYGLMIGEEDAILDTLNSNQIVFNGNNGNETFQGGALADTLNGGAGNDVLYGGGGADTINGGDGDDVLYGEGGSDTINGGDGDDTIDGGGSSDFITGGLGVDILTGGAGNDRFIFTSIAESPNGTPDTITDFGNTTFGNNDVIDLTGLGVGYTWSGLNGSGANQAWYEYDAVNGDTYVYADDGFDVLQIKLDGYSGSLGTSDVLLA